MGRHRGQNEDLTYLRAVAAFQHHELDKLHVSTRRRGNDGNSGRVDPAICSLDIPADMSRAGWEGATNKDIYVATEGFESEDVIQYTSKSLE